MIELIYRKFQFLVVRLKATNLKIQIRSFPFQFLVVRLKDTDSNSRHEPDEISIPCGSIKSLYAKDYDHFP